MLVKDFLAVFPHNQACKLVYFKDGEIVEVKGSIDYIQNFKAYLLELEITTAYTSSKGNYINICI